MCFPHVGPLRRRVTLGFYWEFRTREVMRRGRHATLANQRHGAFDRNMCDTGLPVQPPISAQSFAFPNPLIPKRCFVSLFPASIPARFSAQGTNRFPTSARTSRD